MDASPDGPFGVGDFPADLDRVSWGALFWGPLWAFAHGLWSWLAIRLAWEIGSRTFFVFLNNGRMTMSSPLRAAVSVAAALISWGLVSVLALRANRLNWQRARNSKGESRYRRTSGTVTQYLSTQSLWMKTGVVMTALGYAVGMWRVREDMEWLIAAAAASSVSLAAIALLRMRDHRQPRA